jgi:hypothetical protein
MRATDTHFCPLCQGKFCPADAVRTHLIADHERSAVDADELIARFDIAQPIPKPQIYCVTEERRNRSGRSRDGRAAPEVPVT